MSITKKEAVKLKTLITRYKKASIRDSWKGSINYDYFDKVADDLKQSEDKLFSFIQQITE